MSTKSIKAQAWYMDFAIGMLLFTFTLIVYFSYTNNAQKEDKGDFDLVTKDAKSISNSLALEGYPDDWDNTTVVRIGIADEQQLNATKLKKLKQMNYTLARRKFSTTFDFFAYFLNENGDVLNIKGVCGTGYPLINTTYNIKSAYYYQDEDDDFLKDFMRETFNADIYNDDIDDLVANLSKYGFLVMEHPLLSGGDFATNKAKIENFSSRGGLLIISGELATPSTNSMVGADFKKKSGLSSSQRISIVNDTDPYLSLSIGQSMVFNQYYHVENKSESVSFLRIATFNQTDDNSISKWKYGNGTVYFFSDFDVSAFNGNFIDVVEGAASGLIEGTCNPINFLVISPKYLAKTERYLIYNSKPAKMTVYVWQ
ncbi:hypothetical protein HY637_03805 [Candidatus Woesearchaeota archaeon]|nr:hypothetical protein [Candidatus Woesearchaeota archaeon]